MLIISSYFIGTVSLRPEETAVFTTLERLTQLFLARFDDYKIEQVTATTTLDNLGLDSLDIIDFMFDIENEFNIKIPDQEFRVRTIQDMVDAVDRFISEQNIGSSSHH